MQCPEAVEMLRGKTFVWISVLNGVHLVYVEVDGVSMLKSTPAFFVTPELQRVLTYQKGGGI